MKLAFKILLIALTFASCRQDIVPPDNPAGNINEPFFSRTNFSYTFTINADRITRKVVDYTNLNSTRSRFFLVIDDHSSGSVEIEIHDDENYIIYTSLFETGTSGVFREIEGYEPDFITLNFIDFTGKFRITLTERE